MKKPDMQPNWDALPESDRQKRLEKAAGELGYTWQRGRWRDGQGMALPDSWVLQRALRTFGAELEVNCGSHH